MNVLYDERGREVHLESLLGKGGEGNVYRVVGAARGCVKILHESHRTSEKTEKVRSMIACKPSGELSQALAWPIAMVFVDAALSEFAGFVMEMVDRRSYVELQCTWDECGAFGWGERVRVAYELSTVIAQLHAVGHRVGDLQIRNILVNSSCRIALVDCDSFQVLGRDGKMHDSGIGLPDYLPPELLVRIYREQESLRGIDRYASDLHALAVLVFQLLMSGTHPYSARGPGVGDAPSSRVEKIIAGTYPYIENGSQYFPPTAAHPIWLVPPALQEMFVISFVKAHARPEERPSAEAWCRNLRAALEHTARCGKVSDHSYSAHLPNCPWCGALVPAQTVAIAARDPKPGHSDVGIVVFLIIVALILVAVALI
jgi:DNA-binding helix-hairpin-helix protein with protein kinase domain